MEIRCRRVETGACRARFAEIPSSFRCPRVETFVFQGHKPVVSPGSKLSYLQGQNQRRSQKLSLTLTNSYLRGLNLSGSTIDTRCFVFPGSKPIQAESRRRADCGKLDDFCGKVLIFCGKSCGKCKVSTDLRGRNPLAFSYFQGRKDGSFSTVEGLNPGYLRTFRAKTPA